MNKYSTRQLLAATAQALMSTSGVAIVAGLVGLAVVATVRIVTRELDPALRTRQLLLCWLLPVVGPLLALAAHRGAVAERDPELDYQRSIKESPYD